MPVLGLEELKEHLNIFDTGSDDELLSFAARAEAAVASRVGPLEATAVTERVRGYGRSLAPKITPILSVTSVTPVGGSAITADLHAPENGRGASTIEYVDGSWFGSRWYDVEFEAGRDVLPEDLRLAVLEVLRFYWESQRGNSAVTALPRSDAEVAPALASPDYFPWARIQHLLEPYEQVWL